MQIPRAEIATSTNATTPTSTSKNSSPLTPARGPDCTSTRAVGVTATHGPVRTIWTSTATTTSHVDCGGCRFIALKTMDPYNPGPMVEFKSTETASAAITVTEYVCLKTPSVVGPTATATNTLPIVLTKRAGCTSSTASRASTSMVETAPSSGGTDEDDG